MLRFVVAALLAALVLGACTPSDLPNPSRPIAIPSRVPQQPTTR